MSVARYIVGDIRHIAPRLEPGSVDLMLTSPPFLALRSYLEPGHPDKGAEIGSESTPGEFIDALLEVVEALTPALAAHGSMVIELGDTYAGSGGAGGDYNPGGARDGQERFDGSASKAYGTGAAPRMPRSNRPKYRPEDHNHRRDRVQDTALGILPAGMAGHWKGEKDGWPLDKSLCLIPELFRIALVYGFNPLTGRPTPRWRARNVIRWCRPNPPVGALGDKVRPATSELVVICRDRSRYFDLDAVRHPAAALDRRQELYEARMVEGPRSFHDHSDDARQGRSQPLDIGGGVGNPAGAPPLDWWEIPTEPYPGAHYATWPKDLCVIPIKAMCPPRVCRTCAQPSRRIVGDPEYLPSANYRGGSSFAETDRIAADVHQHIGPGGAGLASVVRHAETLGWTDCGHGDWRPGLVLDPFAGSGTTLAVAVGHGRAALGVDLDARNAELARARVGPLFFELAETPA